MEVLNFIIARRLPWAGWNLCGIYVIGKCMVRFAGTLHSWRSPLHVGLTSRKQIDYWLEGLFRSEIKLLVISQFIQWT